MHFVSHKDAYIRETVERRSVFQQYNRTQFPDYNLYRRFSYSRPHSMLQCIFKMHLLTYIFSAIVTSFFFNSRTVLFFFTFEACFLVHTDFFPCKTSIVWIRAVALYVASSHTRQFKRFTYQ